MFLSADSSIWTSMWTSICIAKCVGVVRLFGTESVRVEHDDFEHVCLYELMKFKECQKV